MAHPQNSPRGLFTKQSIHIPVGKGVAFEDFSTSSDLLGADVMGLSLTGSGLVFSSPGAGIPSSVDRGAALHVSSNSTGVAVALNTTGTTWKYFSVTSVQAT